MFNNTAFVLRKYSHYRSILMFKVIDPSQDDDTMIPPLLAYAKQGSATGKLLYANYGRREDFDVLKKNFRISNCEGYIVIIRYGRISRGDKVTVFYLGAWYSYTFESVSECKSVYYFELYFLPRKC